MFRGTFIRLGLIVATLAAAPATARAGMHGVTFSDVARLRITSISFFLVGFVFSAVVIRWLWNYLANDFKWLPRLSFGKACGVVGLWALLFVIVLMMISGARELMTPGAWERNGFTYQIKDDTPPVSNMRSGYDANPRRRQLAGLARHLLAFAAQHGGRFPDVAEIDLIAATAWQTADPSGIRYVYLPGHRATDTDDRNVSTVVAYEPAIYSDGSYTLTADGKINLVPHADAIRPATGKESSDESGGAP